MSKKKASPEVRELPVQRNLFLRLQERLKAYQPNLFVILDLYAKNKPDICFREVDTARDSTAESAILLIESLFILENLRAQLELHALEQRRNEQEVDPKMARLSSELMTLEPMILRAANVAAGMNDIAWGPRTSDEKKSWEYKRELLKNQLHAELMARRARRA